MDDVRHHSRERTGEAPLSPEEQAKWSAVLRGGVEAQRLVSGCIAVGGTVAALYAAHRVSEDVDHIVTDLRDRFDDILDSLSRRETWKTNRIQRPVLILGALGEVPIGFRAPRRTTRIETTRMSLPTGDLTVPTLEEMVGIKAFLAYHRNALRDYLDFAVLASLLDEGQVIGELLQLDEQYAGVQECSIRLEVAKALSLAAPYDLEGTDLSRYRGLVPDWRDWNRVGGICRRMGGLLGERIIAGS